MEAKIIVPRAKKLLSCQKVSYNVHCWKKKFWNEEAEHQFEMIEHGMLDHGRCPFPYWFEADRTSWKNIHILFVLVRNTNLKDFTTDCKTIFFNIPYLLFNNWYIIVSAHNYILFKNVKLTAFKWHWNFFVDFISFSSNISFHLPFIKMP